MLQIVILLQQAHMFLSASLEDNLAWDIKAREHWKQQYSHLLDAHFERTFFDTTYLQLWINHDHGAEAFLLLVDSFRGFVNLEKLYVVNDSLLKLLRKPVLSLVCLKFPGTSYVRKFHLPIFSLCLILSLTSKSNLELFLLNAHILAIWELLLDLQDTLPRHLSCLVGLYDFGHEHADVADAFDPR